MPHILEFGNICKVTRTSEHSSSISARSMNFFSLGVLKWSRIALMGSLQISTGSALGKLSMQE